MSDAIFVNGLALHAYHGVMQHEAKVGQTFKLDLLLDIDLAEASRTDKLKNTVSYDTVVKIASEAFCSRRYKLVEAAAGAVASAVLDGFPQVRRIRVTVHKPHAPIAATFDDVGVVIERSRIKQDGNQPPFINAVIEVATDLEPHVLLSRTQDSERALGRDRAKQRHWGPRTIDLDMLLYDDRIINDERLTLPHPRMLERAFVLVPLAEIAPDRFIGGIRVRDALARIDAQGVEKLLPR
jgi:dihydroneopterin aldolase